MAPVQGEWELSNQEAVEWLVKSQSRYRCALSSSNNIKTKTKLQNHHHRELP